MNGNIVDKIKYVLHKIGKVLFQLIHFTGYTILYSLIYKKIISLGFFNMIGDPALHNAVFCIVELLIIILYWYRTYLFAEICDAKTRTIKQYYILISIIFVLYNIIYWYVYFTNTSKFNWLFRITLNLIGIRFVTTAPSNYLPYMYAYLGITLLVFIGKPLITTLLLKNWEKKGIL